MKSTCYLSLFLLLCLFMISCEETKVKSTEEPIEIAFGLNIPFIATFDELITKSGVDNNYTYGIRIAQFNENTSSYEPYAMGAFNDLSLAKITLYSNRKYNIEAAVINNLNSGMFSGMDGTKRASDNTFSMGSSISLIDDWHNSIAWGDSYYGEKTDYMPSDNTLCGIDLASQTTGVKMIIEGANTGSVRLILTDYWYNNVITCHLNEYTEMSSFLSIEEMFGKTSEYTTNVKIEYIDANGNPITLDEKRCTFKKGNRKVFKIKLNDSNNSIVESGFAFSYNVPILDDENPETIEGAI